MLINNLHSLNTRRHFYGKRWVYEDQEIFYTDATDGQKWLLLAEQTQTAGRFSSLTYFIIHFFLNEGEKEHLFQRRSMPSNAYYLFLASP